MSILNAISTLSRFSSGSHEDPVDLRHRNSRTSLDNTAKATEAARKNDELASRLGHSSSPSASSKTGLGHRKSDSQTSNYSDRNTSGAGTGLAAGSGAAALSSGSRTEPQIKNDELANAQSQGYDTTPDANTRAAPVNTGHGVAGIGAGKTGGRGVLDPENDGLEGLESRNESLSDRDLGKRSGYNTGVPTDSTTGDSARTGLTTAGHHGVPVGSTTGDSAHTGLGNSTAPTSERSGDLDRVGSGRIGKSTSGSK